MCKTKVPLGYGCVDGTNHNGKYNTIVSDCYTNCFNNFYSCPTNNIPTSSSYVKTVIDAGTIMVIVFVSCFAMCLVKSTLLKDFRIGNKRRSSTSRVHIIAATSHSDNYTNVV